MRVPNLVNSAVKATCFIVFSIALAAALPVLGQSGQPLSKADALERATALIGVSDTHKQSALSTPDPQAIVFADSTTPFLGKYAYGRTAWKVVVNTSNQNTKNRSAEQSFCPMEVYLDSLDGHLLKVECNLKDLNPKVQTSFRAPPTRSGR